jgi:hypothetical protein
MLRGRKITGQRGDYECICWMKSHATDAKLFTEILLTFDMFGKLGFVLLVTLEDFKILCKVSKALEDLGDEVPQLVFVERFKVHKDQKVS